MQKASFRQKTRYGFDNLMSKGTPTLIGSLAIVSIVLIIIISFIAWISKSAPDKSFMQLAWMGLMRTLDAGTMGGDEGSWIFLLLMFAVTLGGVFVISILIGLLTTGIETKLSSLRKGRSLVIENNHTIILGWSEQIYTIISELIEANSNQKSGCIVIMGQKDKIEMEDEIKERIETLKNTKIVCRQGSPIEFNDLKMVNINYSKSIIILDDSDSNVIKTVLAIVNSKSRRQEPFHITAVLNESGNLCVGNIAGMDQVEFILGKEIISRIVAQTCRQPGLSIVYTELLDFGGDEIYFSKIAEVAGKTFREALFMFEKSAVIGINTDGTVKLNPPMDTLLTIDDEIISISEDDDTVLVSDLKDFGIDFQSIVSDLGNVASIDEEIEKTLILGWNEQAVTIICELDNYVPVGSILTVAASFPGIKDNFKIACSKKIKNQVVEFIDADINDREVLNELTSRRFNHIIILSYTDRNIQEADAVTLITLLHLRDISEKTGVKFSIISEVLDIRNRSLAETAKVNDFIISDTLLSLLLTQVSENKYLNLVFKDLFDTDGSEIYIKKANNYIDCSKNVNFYTIVESAQQKNEVAIGYKIFDQETDPQKNYGIYINPAKSDLIALSDEDSIIVLAEE
jgi:ion channel POLLUX/CASTOR